MPIVKHVTLGVIFSLACIASNRAAEGNPLIGTWIEEGPQGGIVTEFTPSTMSLMPVDPKGRPTHAANLAHVRYEVRDSTVLIKFEERGGGELTASVKGPDAIELVFPGQGAHELVRAQAN